MRHTVKLGAQSLQINNKFISFDDIWSIITLSPDWKNISTANAHLGHLQHTINQVAQHNERLKHQNEYLLKKYGDLEYVKEFPILQRKEELKAEISNAKDLHYFWGQDPNITDFKELYENRFKKKLYYEPKRKNQESIS